MKPDHSAANAQDRPLHDSERESASENLPAPPSFQDQADRPSQFPCPRNRLCPIARRCGRALSPVPAEPPNPIVPGKSPYRRNVVRDAGANPEAANTAREICECVAGAYRSRRCEIVLYQSRSGICRIHGDGSADLEIIRSGSEKACPTHPCIRNGRQAVSGVPRFPYQSRAPFRLRARPSGRDR